MTRVQPRIPPLADDDLDETARELLFGARVPKGTAGGTQANIMTTLVRHPKLFRGWGALGLALMPGKLPARDREILILRTSWRCRSEYEWGQHCQIAREAGLTSAECQRLRNDPQADSWSPNDLLLIRVADELFDECRITDEVWAQLEGLYDEQQLMEVPMLVGFYHMLALALNAYEVPQDPGLPGFSE